MLCPRPQGKIAAAVNLGA
ncbi:Serine/threonine-protein kinase MHK [Zea mays]|uniref:Serine/threonine-protein kinase MHK n=1 Tax=Zea mays TaxID=4577 RepID=A0A1D6HH40_MAIZE|nr:Serine/threonine-protein kinase MHK [Zea mays]AQK73876.1 Serine/threonine-protein kinase MHK [Zea mays]